MMTTDTGPASSLESLLATLGSEAYYQSPGGRRMLMAASLVAGLPSHPRVLDVQCGIGSASVDLAEAFAARVDAFDDYSPYLAFGKQLATTRNVARQIEFRSVRGKEAVAAFEAATYDVVLGLGGGLSDTLPGGLTGGLQAAATWLKDRGVLICGDLVAPGSPSELMRIVFGDSLLGERDYFTALDEAGFDVVFACRSTSADWDDMLGTIQRLRNRSLDLGPEDERHRQQLTQAARNHPEVAYLNVVARKR